MKRQLILLCLLTIGSHALTAKEPFNILINGASAAQGIYTLFPKMAQASGDNIYTQMVLLDNAQALMALDAIDAGKEAEEGYSIENVPKKKFLEHAASGYVRHANIRNTMIHLGELIKERRWDAVVLSINTHLAVYSDVFAKRSESTKITKSQVGTYIVSFERKVAFFKKHLPGVKIYLFQNFAPRNDSSYKIMMSEPTLQKRGVIGPNEVLTEDKWAQVSSENFYRCAKGMGLTPLFGGDLLYAARRYKNFGLIDPPNHIDAKALYATKGEDFRPIWELELDFRHNMTWRSIGKGKMGWIVDHHPNWYGNYMIGAMCYEVILGKSVVGNDFIEKGRPVDKNFLSKIQNFVHETLKDETKYPLYPNLN